MKNKMTWEDIQKRFSDDDPLWAKCLKCGKRVHEGVGHLHIEEEHPEIARILKQAIHRSIMTRKEK